MSKIIPIPENSRIPDLMREVEFYRQAVQDAKDALASAEEELDDLLAFEYEKQQAESCGEDEPR